MALNPNRLIFFLTQISNSNYNTFRSTVAQLFGYLVSEVKDNPVFEKYENDREKWANWPREEDISYGAFWSLPDNFEESKSLVYDIYRSIAERDSSFSESLAVNLFRENYIGDNFSKLNTAFLGYLEQALDEIVNANTEFEDNAPRKNNNKTVFIIHGHDNQLKADVQLLLTRAGVGNVVLHEQADKGRTIIDKLINETEIAGYAIALLTPDDITHVGNNRARQNVILEIGYFLGKLGKERLRMIVKGDIEIPSDLQGILYEKYDLSGAWKIKLLKELQAVGIYVDIQTAIDSF